MHFCPLSGVAPNKPAPPSRLAAVRHIDLTNSNNNRVNIMTNEIWKIIAGLLAFLAIMILAPMFFTYISEGDLRPPGQVVPGLHGK